ncbi:MAG: P-loop NTPase family protein [Vulcanimicrobiaceae bacterium]
MDTTTATTGQPTIEHQPLPHAQRIGTWKGLLEFLGSRPEITSVTLEPDRVTIATPTSTHDATAALDGERLIFGYLTDRNDDERTYYHANRHLEVVALEPGFGAIHTFLVRSLGRDILHLRLVADHPEARRDYHTLDSLLPVVRERTGLVILAGRAESGISTAYAVTLFEALSARKPRMSVLIGAPIAHDVSSANVHTVGFNVGIRNDLPSAADALSAAVNLHASVIGLDTGLDDPNTYEALALALNSGATIIATTNGTDAIQTLMGIRDLLPSERRDFLWRTIANSLLGIAALALVPSRFAGERIEAPDIFLASATTLNDLLAANDIALRDAIERGVGGSLSRDAKLRDSILRDITLSEARRYAIRPDALG